MLGRVATQVEASKVGLRSHGPKQVCTTQGLLEEVHIHFDSSQDRDPL